MNEHRFGLTDGLFIAAVPVLGYWINFLFELGYCRFYSIPPDFIEIGTIGIMISITALVGFGMVILAWSHPIVDILRRFPAVIRSKIYRMTCGVIPILCIGLAANWRFTKILWMLCPLLAIYLIGDIFVPITFNRQKITVIDKLRVAHESDLARVTTIDEVAEFVGVRNFKLFLLAVLLSLFAYTAGGLHARFKTDYPVLEDDKYVVLKTYKDFFIATHFDKSTNILSGDLKLVPIDKEIARIKILRLGNLSSIHLDDPPQEQKK